MDNTRIATAFLAASLCAHSFAGPITTVPWNGHVGAVSFTFDDALSNQVQNLKPILDEMPDVQVTLFLTNMGNGLNANATGFASFAKAGHEIGNHTLSHGHLSGTAESELNGEIVDFAGKLESTIASSGAETNVRTFAAPFCETNETVQNVIAKRHIANRNCGWHGRNSWGSEPDWYNIMSKIWTRSGATVSEMLSAMDTAAFIGSFENANTWDVSVTEGTWLVVLNHGVSDDAGDDYAINPADIKKIMERAREDKLWTASFGTVAAYYRAHFVLDAAESVADAKGFTVSWKSPHEYMPKSVPLRVKIDAKDVGENIVVEQGGKVIKPESDGTFVIEFMELSLSVRASDGTEIPEEQPQPGSSSASKPSETESAASSSNSDGAESGDKVADSKSSESKSEIAGDESANSSSSASGNVFLFAQNKQNMNASMHYAIFDMNGVYLGSTEGFKVPQRLPNGRYIVCAKVGNKAVSVKIVGK